MPAGEPAPASRAMLARLIVRPSAAGVLNLLGALLLALPAAAQEDPRIEQLQRQIEELQRRLDELRGEVEDRMPPPPERAPGAPQPVVSAPTRSSSRSPARSTAASLFRRMAPDQVLLRRQRQFLQSRLHFEGCLSGARVKF